MTSLLSWGRYPRYPQIPHACAWRGDLAGTLDKLVVDSGSTLPFGNGRSYGDSCLAVSDHVLHTRWMNRLIGADWANGIVIAEAGATLDELLKVTIPRGWFLPVTPGTKFVTLGGAVANDVHGKNHHRKGTFGCHVRALGLCRSDWVTQTCSPTENVELFTATIGGLGLTGVLDWVELQLTPIDSDMIDAVQIRFDSLDEFFELSSELDPNHEYSVAWIDCLAKGKSAGRGVYLVGDHSAEGSLKYDSKSKLNVPITPPISAVNRVSLQLFNMAYYHGHRPGRLSLRMGYEPFFYPLDRILNWNRIYGGRGFQQYQCVVPEKDATAAVRGLLAAIAAERSGSFLAVLKRFGDVPSPGLLSFPMQGTTLALDFPQRGERTERLFSRLDAIVNSVGGRLYPAKDAHMRGEDFRAWYPAWQQVEALRDPAITSRFWQRVTKV